MSEPANADELKKSLKKVTVADKEYYVAEGDLLVPDDRFADYAAERLGHKSLPVFEVKSDGKTAQLLGVTGDGNKPLRWAPGVVLTYYIQKETFPGNLYSTVRSCMTDATQAWMDVCGIEFRHMVQLDSDAAARDEQTVFDVRQIDAGGGFMAAAFFPNDPPSRRTVIIDPLFFVPGLGFDQTGVLRHELGHVLGFRHEMIRSGAPPVCPKESLDHTIELTDYDPQSVMHYFCGDVGDKDLKLTSLDRAGARLLYGPPFNDFDLIRP